YTPDRERSVQIPIYMTTAYLYTDVEEAAALFNLEREGNIYTRIGNPTTRVFEERIGKLERGVASLATASGMGAIFYSLANLAQAGDRVAISSKLYGGSITLATQTLKRLGVEAHYFDPTRPETLEPLLEKGVKGVLFESIGNPSLVVPDFEGIVERANQWGVVTICDNTLATPYGVKPIELGVDLVVHSTSKYIVGNGTAIGGVIVEGPSCRDKLGRGPYPQFTEPDPSYHGLRYIEKFEAPFTARARLGLLRDFGAVPSPFNSWLGILGLEHLGVRFRTHSENGLKVAQFLASHPKVKGVNYPLLGNQLGEKYLKLGGGIVSFEVAGYREGVELVRRLKLFKLVTNIGDSRSLITHPASTTHRQLSPTELEEAGVSPGLIRLSVGLEHIEDLIADLAFGLEGI
ncbi:MAG: PLP-dependent transferase, partial [Campylobacterales bacterium]